MQFFLNDAKKQHIVVETCLYEAAGSLPVMPSLLPQNSCFVILYLSILDFIRFTWKSIRYIHQNVSSLPLFLLKCRHVDLI
jgi:uncharacterized protein (DUF1919 family)